MKKKIHYHINRYSRESDQIRITDNISDIVSHPLEEENTCFSSLDVIFDAFVVTPLSILFYTSTWDTFDSFISTHFYYPMLASIFLVCNLSLLAIYLFQYKIQTFHDELKQNSSAKYYGKDFFLRCLFSYILNLAYNLQWVTYWDFYDNFTERVHHIYFFVLALISLLVYKFGLNRSMASLSDGVPFTCRKDANFDTYFLQNKLIKLENDQDQKVFDLK